ncbi:MAG: hypothetical protein ACYC6C_13375 [Coriobacteriia bacterium]
MYLNAIAFAGMAAIVFAGACSPVAVPNHPVSTTSSECSEEVVTAATNDVQRVAALRKSYHMQRARKTRLLGARVFIASPGRTAEQFQSLVDCAIAHDTAEATSPLALPDINARVRSVDGGFAVDISSRDRGVAREIFRRASQLRARGGG